MLAGPCLPVKLSFGNHHQSAWKWVQCYGNELVTIIFLLALTQFGLLEFWKAGHDLQRKNELTILNSQLLITEQSKPVSGMTYSDIQLDLRPYATLDPHAQLPLLSNSGVLDKKFSVQIKIWSELYICRYFKKKNEYVQSISKSKGWEL